MLFLKQSTSVVVQFGPFVDKTDGVALEVGLSSAMDNATTGIRLSKNGAVLVDRNDSTAPAYDAMGLYRITLDATDTATLGTLKMIFEEAATTLPVWADFMIMPANVWDSMFGADNLEVDVTLVSGVAEDLPTATALAAVKTETALIVADTDELQVDWLNNGRLDLILDSRMAEASISTTGGAVDTVTAVTNAIVLPTIPGNWITAAGINASALNGKGDWNIGKTGYALTVADWNVGKTGYALTVADWNVGKTGYQLSATGVDDIWDELMAGHVTVDTAGLVMNEWQDGGRLDLILDSRMAEASIDTTAGAVDVVTTVLSVSTPVNIIEGIEAEFSLAVRA